MHLVSRFQWHIIKFGALTMRCKYFWKHLHRIEIFVVMFWCRPFNCAFIILSETCCSWSETHLTSATKNQQCTPVTVFGIIRAEVTRRVDGRSRDCCRLALVICDPEIGIVGFRRSVSNPDDNWILSPLTARALISLCFLFIL